MLLIIFFILVFLGVISNSRLIYNLQKIFIIIFIAGNTGNPDYIVYKGYFFNSENLIKKMDFSIAFKYINFIGKKLGLTYEEFSFLITIILVLMVFKIVNKYSKHKTFTISLFMLYPLIDNLIQRKNFIGTIILLYSIKFLKINSLKNLFKYLLSLMLAFLIHPIFIIYSLVPFLEKLKEKKWAVMVLLFIIFLIIGHLLKNELVELGIKFGRNYNYRTLSLEKAFALGIWQTIGIFLLKNSKPKKRIEKIVYEMNCYSLCLIPLYSSITINLIRIPRNLMLINHITISNSKNKSIKIIYFLYILFSYLFFYFYSLDNFYEIYEKNIFLFLSN